MEELVFGDIKPELNYRKRKGVYAVIFNETKDKIVTVQTTTGHYFLPGGGLEGNETNEECLEREVLEETGYKVLISSFIGKAMNFFQSTKNEPILSEGYFYLATLVSKVQDPIEEDHLFTWLSVDRVEELLIHKHHIWAVKEGVK
ncbi:NUDIX hydrolase [Microbacteriaceae bacterium 4G12]